MEIHQLTYFVAVAETGSFSRAAERCNVAQPSLSQQIIKLELELGHPLFFRLRRKVVLTETGQALLPRAASILNEVEQIRRHLPDEIEAGLGSLAAGFIPTIAPFVLPRVVQRFMREYPHAQLTVHEDLTDGLIRGIIEGKLDVGITSLPISNRQIRTEEIATEALVAAASREMDPFHGNMICSNELEGFPFIALSEMHCLGEQVQSYCSQHNLRIHVVCHAAQLTTVQNCLELGLGISLVPLSMAKSDISGKLVYRTVSDAEPQRKIAASMHARREPSFLARRFISIVREEYPIG